MNLAGLKASSKLQNTLATLEIGAVLAVALVGLLVAPSADVTGAAAPSAPAAGALGLAMVFVLLTFGGWNEAAYVSAEVRGGPRAILRTLLASIAVITLLYLLFVAGALHALGFEGLRRSEAVGIDVIESAFGTYGAQLIGIAVAIASLTSMNATLIVGARSNMRSPTGERSPHGQLAGERGVPVAGLAAGRHRAGAGPRCPEKDGLRPWWNSRRRSSALLHAEARAVRPAPQGTRRLPPLPGAPARCPIVFVLTCRAVFEHRLRPIAPRVCRARSSPAERWCSRCGAEAARRQRPG
jgi:hypothetical protein